MNTSATPPTTEQVDDATLEENARLVHDAAFATIEKRTGSSGDAWEGARVVRLAYVKCRGLDAGGELIAKPASWARACAANWVRAVDRSHWRDDHHASLETAMACVGDEGVDPILDEEAEAVVRKLTSLLQASLSTVVTDGPERDVLIKYLVGELSGHEAARLLGRASRDAFYVYVCRVQRVIRTRVISLMTEEERLHLADLGYATFQGP